MSQRHVLLVAIVATIWLLRSDRVLGSAEVKRPRDATTAPVVERLSFELARIARIEKGGVGIAGRLRLFAEDHQELGFLRGIYAYDTQLP